MQLVRPEVPQLLIKGVYKMANAYSVQFNVFGMGLAVSGSDYCGRLFNVLTTRGNAAELLHSGILDAVFEYGDVITINEIELENVYDNVGDLPEVRQLCNKYNKALQQEKEDFFVDEAGCPEVPHVNVWLNDTPNAAIQNIMLSSNNGYGSYYNAVVNGNVAWGAVLPSVLKAIYGKCTITVQHNGVVWAYDSDTPEVPETLKAVFK